MNNNNDIEDKVEKKINSNILKTAEKICDDLKISMDDYELTILDEINIGIMNPKVYSVGTKRYVIGENGSYLTCFASEPLNQSIEMFNEGQRDSIFKNSEIVDSIIDKIKEAPINTELTIAKLINYNPEANMVNPQTQGEVFNAVEYKCRENGINIEQIESGFGGLAYYYQFKKVK